jgi:UDP-glucose 4-epimerase
MMSHYNSAPKIPKRVVVIGSAGFVGGAVADRISNLDIPILGISRNDLDLEDKNSSKKLLELLNDGDTVVAAAAIAPCKNADMFLKNMKLVTNISQAISQSSIGHFINIGSDAVYSDSDKPLTEDSDTSPDSLHGIMHLARELMFRKSIGIPACYLRPTLIYGALDPHNGYGPNRFRRNAARGENIELFGAGEELRDHVLINDVSKIIENIILWHSYGTLNVATGEVISFRHIAGIYERLTNHRIKIIELSRSGPMPHNGYRAFDVSLCKRAFPAFNYTRVEDGLQLVGIKEE